MPLRLSLSSNGGKVGGAVCTVARKEKNKL